VLPLAIGLVVLWVLVISFIAPFLQGALLQASQSKSLVDLFQVGRTIQVTTPHYWRVVWSYILVMGLGLLYLVGSVADCLHGDWDYHPAVFMGWSAECE
jgi:hypothetical protein